MSTQPDDPADKPSILDLVTDPEKFDRWQRKREREEAEGGAPPARDEAGERRPPDDAARGRPPDRA